MSTRCWVEPSSGSRCRDCQIARSGAYSKCGRTADDLGDFLRDLCLTRAVVRARQDVAACRWRCPSRSSSPCAARPVRPRPSRPARDTPRCARTSGSSSVEDRFGRRKQQVVAQRRRCASAARPAARARSSGGVESADRNCAIDDVHRVELRRDTKSVIRPSTSDAASSAVGRSVMSVRCGSHGAPDVPEVADALPADDVQLDLGALALELRRAARALPDEVRVERRRTGRDST